MYCPMCSAQNIDDARFCRACGADISLVPQALTGRLPEAQLQQTDEGRASRRRRKRGDKEPPSVENGVKNIFGGMGFVFVSLAIFAFAPAGKIWFFWMLIPAFFMLGEGVATVMRAKREREHERLPARSAFQQQPSAVRPAARAGELPPRDTSEFLQPPSSITEGTTRHLAGRGREADDERV